MLSWQEFVSNIESKRIRGMCFRAIRLSVKHFTDFKYKNAAFQLLYRKCEQAKKVSLAPLENKISIGSIC